MHPGISSSDSTPSRPKTAPSTTSTPATPRHPVAPKQNSFAPPPATKSGPSTSLSPSSSFRPERQKGSPSSQNPHYSPTSSLPNSIPSTPSIEVSHASPPQRRLSIKRLFAKSTSSSPSTDALPDSKKTIGQDNFKKQVTRKSEDELRRQDPEPSRRRKPSVLTLDVVGRAPEKVRVEGHASSDKPQPQPRKSVEDASNIAPKSSKARPPPLHAGSSNSLTYSQQRSSKSDIRQERSRSRGRTSSDHGHHERSGSKPRRERRNLSPLPSLPLPTGAQFNVSAPPTPTATALGAQFVTLEFQPPSPSLDIFGSSRSPVSLSRAVSPVVPRSRPSMDSPRNSGKPGVSSPTTPAATTSSGHASYFDRQASTQSQFASAPTTPSGAHKRRKSALLTGVANALGGLEPKRNDAETEGKAKEKKRSKMNLLKKASRKFAGEPDIGMFSL